MAGPNPRSGIEMTFTFGKAPRPKPSRDGDSDDDPFVILVLGDFGGRGGRGVLRPLREAKPRKVDADTLEAELRRLDAKLTLASGTPTPVTINVRELDDLHPDHL